MRSAPEAASGLESRATASALGTIAEPRRWFAFTALVSPHRRRLDPWVEDPLRRGNAGTYRKPARRLCRAGFHVRPARRRPATASAVVALAECAHAFALSVPRIRRSGSSLKRRRIWDAGVNALGHRAVGGAAAPDPGLGDSAGSPDVWPNGASRGPGPPLDSCSSRGSRSLRRAACSWRRSEVTASSPWTACGELRWRAWVPRAGLDADAS